MGGIDDDSGGERTSITNQKLEKRKQLKKENKKLIEEVLKVKEENEKLKARILFLEYQPYRGPEFFKLLKEEFPE